LPHSGIVCQDNNKDLFSFFAIFSLHLGYPSIVAAADKYNPSGLISKSFRSLLNNKSGSVYYPLGILLGLLPCGPVYTALIGTARAGMEAKSIYQGILSGMGFMAPSVLGPYCNTDLVEYPANRC